jgi:hypothetical protein
MKSPTNKGSSSPRANVRNRKLVAPVKKGGSRPPLKRDGEVYLGRTSFLETFSFRRSEIQQHQSESNKLFRKGDIKGALFHLKEVARISEREFGESHSKTMQAKFLLADKLHRANRHLEALPIARQLLKSGDAASNLGQPKVQLLFAAIVARLPPGKLRTRVEKELNPARVSARRVARGTETPVTNGVDDGSEIQKDERGIPLTAPALWPGKRHSPVSIDSFFRRWWSEYLPKGLTFADVRSLDPALGNSLKKHFQEGLPWPEDLAFPNERKTLGWAVEQFRQGNVEALTAKQLIAVGRWLDRNKTASKTPKPHSLGD